MHSGWRASGPIDLDRIRPAYYIDDRYIDRRSSLRDDHLMKARPPDPQALLPLPVSEFQILLALADEERHGYAIKREVADRTNGDVQLGPGTLYGAIKRMVSSGLIAES